jgi:hypothetical protein
MREVKQEEEARGAHARTGDEGLEQAEAGEVGVVRVHSVPGRRVICGRERAAQQRPDGQTPITLRPSGCGPSYLPGDLSDL